LKEKWKRREKKLEKRKTGMRVSGRSVFTLQAILKRKTDEARKPAKKKTQKKSKPKKRK
jgi:hypothetical protein